jgi:uncharacterized protein (DUF1501 family)
MMKRKPVPAQQTQQAGLTRRDLLKRGITFISLSLMSRYMMMQVNPSYDSVFAQASTVSESDRLLVIVQLNGGNDGLNTVIPYQNGLYYDARPRLAVPSEQVLPLEKDLGIGFHPQLTHFQQLYDSGKLAIVQGVGYPNANRSHFRSTDIWMSGHPEKVVGTGWIGRYLDHSIARFHGASFPAANVQGTLPLTLRGNQIVVPSIQSLDSYQFQTDPRYPQDRESRVATFQRIHSQTITDDPYRSILYNSGLKAVESAADLQEAAQKYTSSIQYPADPFGQALKLVAQILTGGLGTQVMHVSIGGFDTHANQNTDNFNHPLLLQYVDAGLDAFYRDLQEHHIADDVIIMTFSEFGRRVRENGSLGTDHGTAAPMFILGNRVRGGLHSEYPSLSQLDSNGDLIHTVDFRQVYATILEDWLQTDSKEILDGSFQKLNFIQ